MRVFAWSKAFEEHTTYDNIPARVRNTEIAYWIGLAFSIGLALVGVITMLSAPSDASKTMFLGLFLAIDAAIAWAVIKIWVHIRLAMYWVIWDAHHRQSKPTPVA